jgi:hypothetical protein
MKLTRPRTLGTLAIAGTLVGATLVLAAPQASAMQTDGFTRTCTAGHGQVGLGEHYNFDVNGDFQYIQYVYTCKIGGNLIWNDVDILGNDY